jgi:hypothetical protein
MLRDLLLLVWVAAAILLPGIAICHWRTWIRGTELIGYGAATGVAIQAVLGLCLVWTRGARWPVAVVSVALSAGAVWYLWRKNAGAELLSSLPRATRVALAIWFSFAVACVALTHLPVALPADLPDGRYIFKESTVPVRIQYLASLPADNYIPYVVSEYFLRRLSFSEIRPILPGQEVTNRTILMSLVALPFRAAMAMPSQARKPLPSFSYVGSEWPDVSTLYREDYYRQLCVVGIFLNSLLLLGLIMAFSGLRDAVILPLGSALYALSPYMLAQTVFIWPKAMAGFFLVLGWHAMSRGLHPAAAAACAALAYHSHPYAVVIAAGMGLYYVERWWRGVLPLRSAMIFATVLAAVLAPWFIWTKLVLQIPADLIAQNFSVRHILAAPLDFVWVRLWNAFNLITPSFLQVYPFNAAAVLEQVLVCLPGAVGVVLVYPALSEAQRSFRPRALWWCGIVASFVALVGLFSSPAVPLVHGFQPAVGALIFWGLIWFRRHVSKAIFWSVAALQVISQLAFLALRSQAITAALP